MEDSGKILMLSLHAILCVVAKIFIKKYQIYSLCLGHTTHGALQTNILRNRFCNSLDHNYFTLYLSLCVCEEYDWVKCEHLNVP